MKKLWIAVLAALALLAIWHYRQDENGAETPTATSGKREPAPSAGQGSPSHKDRPVQRLLTPGGAL